MQRIASKSTAARNTIYQIPEIQLTLWQIPCSNNAPTTVVHTPLTISLRLRRLYFSITFLSKMLSEPTLVTIQVYACFSPLNPPFMQQVEFYWKEVGNLYHGGVKMNRLLLRTPQVHLETLSCCSTNQTTVTRPSSFANGLKTVFGEVKNSLKTRMRLNATTWKQVSVSGGAIIWLGKTHLTWQAMLHDIFVEALFKNIESYIARLLTLHEGFWEKRNIYMWILSFENRSTQL